MPILTYFGSVFDLLNANIGVQLAQVLACERDLLHKGLCSHFNSRRAQTYSVTNVTGTYVKEVLHKKDH